MVVKGLCGGGIAVPYPCNLRLPPFSLMLPTLPRRLCTIPGPSWT